MNNFVFISENEGQQIKHINPNCWKIWLSKTNKRSGSERILLIPTFYWPLYTTDVLSGILKLFWNRQTLDLFDILQSILSLLFFQKLIAWNCSFMHEPSHFIGFTVQKMKLSINDLFGKYVQIHSFQRIWSLHFLYSYHRRTKRSILYLLLLMCSSSHGY